MKRLVAMCALAALVSCGGDDDDDGDGAAVCALDPCGGDPVGVWNVDDVCELSAGLFDDALEDCPTGTVDASGVTFTGTVTLNADGSYTTATTPGGTLRITFPAECLQGVTDCSLLDREGEVTCVAGTAAGSCVCTAMPPSETNTETGTYATSGTSLILTQTEGGDVTTLDYCVSGGDMLVSDPDGASYRLHKN